MAKDDAIIRLARQIDSARQAERFIANADEVTDLRRKAACELHGICADFVSALNSNLSEPALDISPSTFTSEMFRKPGVNLIQISSRGRQVQVAFEATPTPFSTEKFLVPYILEAEVRTYNQQMLDHFEIRNQALFFCVSEVTHGWRFFDWRTRHTGPVDHKFLASLMERLF